MTAKIVGYTNQESIKHVDVCDCCGRIELMHAVRVRTDEGGLMNLGTGCAAKIIYGRKTPKLSARIEAQAKAEQAAKDARNAQFSARATRFTALADAAERDGRDSESWQAMCDGFRISQGKWAPEYIAEHGGILAATRAWAAELEAKIEE